MQKMIWLASYPKSGNTWCRIFLENLLRQNKESIDINQLSIPPENRRVYIEEAVGVSTHSLSREEVDALMPKAYTFWAQQHQHPFCVKTHRSYDDFHPEFRPEKLILGAIYLIRNPLDVATSLAHHLNTDASAAISLMNQADFIYPPTNQHHSIVQQVISSWDRHVVSWVDQQEIPLLLIRYEDMKSDPLNTFRKIAQFTQTYTDDIQLKSAIENSSFEKLKKQEEIKGFRERKDGSGAFFRKGQVGTWHEELSQEHINQIIHQHKEVMERFNYLPS